MSELDLHKFLTEYHIEWRWQLNRELLDVIVFIPCFAIEDFNKLLPTHLFDDGGIECWMQEGYFSLWMVDICEHCGIDPDEVFEETDDKRRIIQDLGEY